MSYVNVFGGSPTQPADVSYRAIALTANQTLSWATDEPNTGTALARLMDVTPTGLGYTLTLPVGENGANGSDTLVRNLSAFSFDVLRSDGVAVATLAASQSVYIYLSDNSTTPGTWQSVLFGAGSSQLSAGSVASASVVALAGTLNSAFPITTLSAAYTVVAGDRGTAFVWTGGSGTISLTSAATLGNNHFFLVRNAGSGALVLDPAGSEQIDGSTTQTLNPTDACIVLCSGSAFYTVGIGRSSTFAYTKLTKSVAGSSDVTLSAAEYANSVMEFTGLLTGNINVIVPTVVGVYFITNSTTGAYTLTVKTVAGTGVAVTQSTNNIAYCDGTNVVLAITGGGSGTVTQVSTGTGLTGGPISGTGTIALANTAVTAGTYPVGAATVNAQGQLTDVDMASGRNAAVWFI
jgi:hypothetical protein